MSAFILKIAGDGLELAHDGTGGFAAPVGCGVEAMIHVVVNQLPLCFRNGLLDGMKLLGEVKAWPAFAEHHNDFSDMPLGTLEPLDDIRMAFVKVRSFLHGHNLSTWRGYHNPSKRPSRPTAGVSGSGQVPTSRALSGAREIGWCTDSAVRILSRRMRLRNSESKAHEQLIDSAALLNLKFLNEFAAI
jgi:hypothetical protein